jgi:hypothetical protein
VTAKLASLFGATAAQWPLASTVEVMAQPPQSSLFLLFVFVCSVRFRSALHLLSPICLFSLVSFVSSCWVPLKASDALLVLYWCFTDALLVLY